MLELHSSGSFEFLEKGNQVAQFIANHRRLHRLNLHSLFIQLTAVDRFCKYKNKELCKLNLILILALNSLLRLLNFLIGLNTTFTLKMVLLLACFRSPRRLRRRRTKTQQHRRAKSPAA